MGWNLNHQLEKITMNVVFEIYNFRLPPTWTVDVVINCPDSYANLDQNDLIWFQLFPSYCADILAEFRTRFDTFTLRYDHLVIYLAVTFQT